MQITPKYFSPIQKMTNFNRPVFKGIQNLENDTFERSEDNIFSPENLTNIFSNPDNEIGHGANNRVFKIPGNEKYVLRVGKNFFNPNITSAKLTKNDTDSDFNIGQKVATITTNGMMPYMPQFIEVLKKQEGTSYGVPHYSAISDESGMLLPNEAPYEDASRKASFKMLLDKASSINVEGYEKMLETFTKAQNAGYSFDPLNSNNILLTDSSINMIDFNVSSAKCSYLELLNSLTNHDYMPVYMHDTTFVDDASKADAYNKAVIIISKFIEAMQNQGLTFDYEYLQNRGALDLFGCPEFKEAVGYDYNSGISIKEHLNNIGLMNSI